MYFGLSQEISKDVYEKYKIFKYISFFMKDYLKNKNFGKGISTMIIGIILVRPKVDFFFQRNQKVYEIKKNA